MQKIYESTRSGNIRKSAANAILEGLAPDGGLFVLEQSAESPLDWRALEGKSYAETAKAVLGKFLDFPDEALTEAVSLAYDGKFAAAEPANLTALREAHILELFHGPTCAFKDFGLQMLPQLIRLSLEATGLKKDILIVTATSGDTGKAALEGFKDAPRTKIFVFYPHEKVSRIQALQMLTQEGRNVGVAAIRGNFDDAQSGVKALFGDAAFLKALDTANIQLSSANSINIGRLAAQTVYYVWAYLRLVASGVIRAGEKINFVVPTGNFGNILSGWYAYRMGLPVNRFICASNANNVLTDFLETGRYDRKRDFLTTISPSMDILISSNLERLLYGASGGDHAKVAGLMGDLREKGVYQADGGLFSTIREIFAGACADDDATRQTIREVFQKERYVLDPHTAVAWRAFEDCRNRRPELLGGCRTVILSTASPYKFATDVLTAIDGPQETADPFAQMRRLAELTGTSIPRSLETLQTKPVLHDGVVDISQMAASVLKALGGMRS